VLSDPNNLAPRPFNLLLSQQKRKEKEKRKKKRKRKELLLMGLHVRNIFT
jgi:hypothetical protein